MSIGREGSGAGHVRITATAWHMGARNGRTRPGQARPGLGYRVRTWPTASARLKPHRPSHAAFTCVMRKGARASVTTRACAEGCRAPVSVRGSATSTSSLLAEGVGGRGQGEAVVRRAACAWAGL